MALSAFVIVLLGASQAQGEGETAAPPATSASSAPRKASKPRIVKGKHAREKEIEGSEARNRFQADTVLKSKYQLNGEPLEVDPD